MMATKTTRYLFWWLLMLLGFGLVGPLVLYRHTPHAPSSLASPIRSSNVSNASHNTSSLIPTSSPSPAAATVSATSSTVSRLLHRLDALSHSEFRLVQQAVLANVSQGIKLQAYVGARYMEELIIWTEREEERNNNRDSALRFYENAAVIEPERALIPYRQGVLLFHRHEWDEAIRHLGIASLLADAEALSSSQLKARILYFMGRCLEQLCGNHEHCLIRQRQAHLAAVRHDPMLAQAYHDLALVYYELDDYANAVLNLKQAMWLDPYREASTALLLVNDYQGHEYVQFTNAVVFQLGTAWKALAAQQATQPLQPASSSSSSSPSSSANNKHHLVFCINTGRAGSHFLATVFRTLDGKHFGFHEPMPQTQWHEHTLEHPLNYSYELRKEKAAVIKEVLRNVPLGSTYSETSLNFITQFQDVVMGEFPPDEYEISVIVLRRNLAKTLKSMMDVGWFDEGMRAVGEQWDRWTHSLESANAVLKPIAPFANLTRAEKLIGYLIDIEARTQKFKADYPGARIFETDLDSLNKQANLRELLAWLGAVPGPLTFQHLGKYTNNKDTSKGVAAALSDTGEHNSYEVCVQEILQYLVRCHELQIEVPALPHFEEYSLLSDFTSRRGHTTEV